MEFTFSIRGALKESWELFRKHVWFFVGLSAVTVLLNVIGGKNTPAIVSLILSIAAFLWSIVMIKFSLLAADSNDSMLSWKSVKTVFPNLNQTLGFLGVAILSGLLTLGGFILLIIPGIWIGFRLSLANLSFLDKGEGIRKSLRNSWDMTKGNVFWTAVLVALVSLLLYIVGFVLFGVGILVTYPLALILMAKFYRAVSLHHAGLAPTSVIVQPAEIVAPKEEEHETHEQAENVNQ